MTAADAPFPSSPRRGLGPLALAGAVSLTLHGGVLAAAQWLWQADTPPRRPPMVTIAVVPAAALGGSKTPAPRPQSGKQNQAGPAVAGASPAAPPPARKAAPPKKPAPRRLAALPAWGDDPPRPPRRPRRLLQAATPSTPPPAKPRPHGSAKAPPVVFRFTPVTAAAKPGTPRGATAAKTAAKTTRFGAAQAARPAVRIAARPVAGRGNPAPAYPWISRERGEEGRVVLEVRVTAEGRAAHVAVKKSSGSKRLDHAARDAVVHWRFTPARRAGAAVAGRIDVPITFRLTQSAD